MSSTQRRIPPPFRLEQFALTLFLFAGALAFGVFFALTQANPDFFRISALGWASALLAAPALFILAVEIGGGRLGHWWRLFWTFGWLMLVAHGAASLGVQHLWRPDLIAASLGFWGAVAFWGMQMVWLIDLLAAWARMDWAQAAGPYRAWQVFAAAVVFVAHAFALFTAGDGISRAVGIVLVGTVAIALLVRWNAREQGR